MFERSPARTFQTRRDSLRSHTWTREPLTPPQNRVTGHCGRCRELIVPWRQAKSPFSHPARVAAHLRGMQPGKILCRRPARRVRPICATFRVLAQRSGHLRDVSGTCATWFFDLRDVPTTCAGCLGTCARFPAPAQLSGYLRNVFGWGTTQRVVEALVPSAKGRSTRLRPPRRYNARPFFRPRVTAVPTIEPASSRNRCTEWFA
jgi:hypothetical protein